MKFPTPPITPSPPSETSPQQSWKKSATNPAAKTRSSVLSLKPEIKNRLPRVSMKRSSYLRREIRVVKFGASMGPSHSGYGKDDGGMLFVNDVSLDIKRVRIKGSFPKGAFKHILGMLSHRKVGEDVLLIDLWVKLPKTITTVESTTCILDGGG